MAFDPKPSTWLGAGYAVASHKAEYNTQDASSDKLLPRITDAQADPTTGDIRLLTYAQCEMIYAAWVAMLGVDLPVQMTLSKQDRSIGPNIQRTFTFTFNVNGTDTTVLPE